MKQFKQHINNYLQVPLVDELLGWDYLGLPPKVVVNPGREFVQTVNQTKQQKLTVCLSNKINLLTMKPLTTQHNNN